MAGWTAPRTWVAAETVTAAIMNTHVRDNLLATTGYVRKTADESLNLSTTLQDDDHLLYTINDTGTFVFDLELIVTSAANAAGDFKFGFTFPTGTMDFNAIGADTSLASGNVSTAHFGVVISATSGSTALAYGASTTAAVIRARGHFAATATGTLRLQWAQFASNASNTTVKAGSFMTVRQLV